MLRYVQLDDESLARFFEQVAFSIMVRNGDGYLKNFGVLYTSVDDCRLSPMFDVVTTSIYRYTRCEGGPELEDRTLALKLFAGKHHTKAYPTTEELLRFGTAICGVAKPAIVLARIKDAMEQTLSKAAGDDRIPKALLKSMAEAWRNGMAHSH